MWAKHDLLFEIGVEEVPARMLARALAEWPAQIKAALEAARLGYARIRVLGTPRRLALLVDELTARQPDMRERLVGPPVGVAFAPDGSPTRAGVAFAQKHGLEPAQLTRGEAAGKKGEYALADKFIAGRDTTELLPDLLRTLLTGIAWPKSMRWGWSELAFVRPVQWLVALYGADVVPLTWNGVIAGRHSRGHRFLGPQGTPLVIADAASYEASLRAAFVIVSPDARRDVIAAELLRIERETGKRVRPDAGLLDEVTGLSEYPVAVAGAFDPAYLEVPEEVIVTAMRTHQRYFALVEADGRLAPGFVTLAGTVVRDPAVVIAGNQRVLAARLADARFFFAEDQKQPLGAYRAKLDAIVFQAKLGARANTIGHKVDRMVSAAAELAPALGADVARTRLAASLCKCDLATGVVGEFPELQGVMGMHYARRQLRAAGDAGAEVIATAIAEHYLPKGLGSAMPSSPEAAAVALADRVDTLLGCFATGLEPSGSADPFGLRRAAIGIAQILLERGETCALTLDAVLTAGRNAYGETLAITDAHVAAVREFMRTRLRGVLIEGGLPSAEVDAALGVDGAHAGTHPYDARLRAQALAAVPAGAREVFKRIANILDDAKAKQLTAAHGGPVQPALFLAQASRDNVEWRLHAAIEAAGPAIAAAALARRYPDLIAILAELGPTVAAFFDKGGVMVMDPDPTLRDNRLALLAAVLAPFAQVADMRALAGGGSAA